MSTPCRPRRGVPAALAAASLALGLAVSFAPAATAQTQGVGGSAQMRYAATGGTDCTLHLEMWNNTNGYYAIDFLVDDQEPWRPGWGTGDIGYDWQGEHNEPVWFETGVGYKRNLGWIHSERTINLLDLGAEISPPIGGMMTPIPHRDSDTHTIRYRVILGPDTTDRGPLPEGGFYETIVSGCATPDEGDGTGSLGSLSAGSLGSLSNDGDGDGSVGSSGSSGSSVPGYGGEADGGSTGSLVRIAGTSTAGSGE